MCCIYLLLLSGYFAGGFTCRWSRNPSGSSWRSTNGFWSLCTYPSTLSKSEFSANHFSLWSKYGFICAINTCPIINMLHNRKLSWFHVLNRLGISDMSIWFSINVFNCKELDQAKIPSRTTGNSGHVYICRMLWIHASVSC